jgi:hypothetical protein
MTAAGLLPLAIGLAGLTAQPGAPSFREEAVAEAVSGPCFDVLADCPDTGCADPETEPEHALANSIKRRSPAGTVPKVLTFDDFQSLQAQAKKKLGLKPNDKEKMELDEAGRAKLHNLNSSGGKVSEGDLVRVVGFLVGNPHPNKKESVNCGLTRQVNNDFHIPLASDPDEDDTDGIVVEMIPQSRPEGWSLKALKRVEQERRMVLIDGQLFYDNFHNVNTEGKDTGDPKRFSIFEVHPITKFMVCTVEGGVCDLNNPDQWKALEDMFK